MVIYSLGRISGFLFLCLPDQQLLWLLNVQWNCWTGVKKDKGQKQKLLPWGQRSHRKLLFGINLIIPMLQRLISIFWHKFIFICVIVIIICWACCFIVVYVNIILFYFGWRDPSKQRIFCHLRSYEFVLSAEGSSHFSTFLLYPPFPYIQLEFAWNCRRTFFCAVEGYYYCPCCLKNTCTLF